ncbi:MAG TPA: TIGR03364 family FAD-dependent oxidoreductase [Pseudonocardia sp.]|jgi:FAD dependent oxidoreductase TIGR03364|nr:TIGR03364 family FAD-dependent oxidoreductase [Pseudonocardia sp.]
MRILIVGGGVLGTMHAVEAVERGHQVVQLEREAEARGATVRNFGLVWVSGRAPAELSTTLRARELWERLGGSVAGIGFRPCGSLTVLRTEAELAVAKQAASAPGALEREFELLDPVQTRQRNPALRGDLVGALWCGRDAAVESRVALPAIRAHLAVTGRYTFLPGREARRCVTGPGGVSVHDQTGVRHDADLTVVCPGANLTGLAAELSAGAADSLPVRPVRLQMMQTAPLGEPLPTAIADGDSMRYYPAFAGTELDSLRATEPQHPIAADHHMQLLCVQRAHGGLTIGDTHAYTEPFPFDLNEAPYEYLRAVVEALLGRPLPPIVRRWAGVYAQCTDPTQIVHRAQIDPALWLVTGPGGRGMTLSPAIAEDTANQTGL